MTFKRPTVLYVEDEETDVFLMRRAFILEGLESSLQAVDGARAAMDYLDGKGPFSDRKTYPVPSLVILDLKMTEGSGFEVLEWIRAHNDYKKLNVVILSSSSEANDREHSARLGANDYVVKPLLGSDWVAVVRDFKHRWMGPVPVLKRTRSGKKKRRT